MDTVWKFIEKLKLELPSDPAIFTYGYLFRENKISLAQADMNIPVLIAEIFI